ncbi:LytR/AlgR family response regulator transcription factor [Chitinophaga sp. GCM10012297]|uniref:Response regulator transcription factor n=1 Tax=Chitinophaga chungangae TaxID=2821488 RepID=A0ABS3YIK4_9BACT|nr:LytTR family DNA-binding domain-containing protein [Chitinophaga chungangae]MBO9154518.1 response regulator transcription factor [Chitinophaga chungangae]
MRVPPTMQPAPISCIIVDDEAFAGNTIARMINKIPFLDLKGTFTSPLEALALVNSGGVELVFLDIHMAELSGLEFMNITRSRCRIIIISGYPDYALQGYEYEVIDYLMKPVTFEKLLTAADKAVRLLRGKNAEVFSPVIYLRSDNKIVGVILSKILYVEARRNKLFVHLEDGLVTTYTTLQSIEKRLPGEFFVKVHRSFIVSLTRISTADSDNVYIGNAKIPIGQTFRGGFFERLQGKPRV